MLSIILIYKILLWSLGFLATAYLCICIFYWFFQERVIFVPLKGKNRDAKLSLGFEFEELNIATNDDGKIHMIRIRSQQSRGCILYFHGNTGSISRWAPMAKELSSFGFDVYLPDYRGYGQSCGIRTEEQLYSDTLLVYSEVVKSYPPDKICIYGRSLGSAMATWLAAKHTVNAVVLETPFHSMLDVAGRHLKVIPVKLFLRFQFRNDLYIKSVKSPIMIAHGTKDKLVPYKSALLLYGCVRDREDVQMITIPGGKHSNLNGYPLMRRSLEEFFDKHFGPKQKGIEES